MRRFLVLSLLLFAGLFAFAQNPIPEGRPFYYFGSEKVFLQESNDRIYMRLPEANARALTEELRRGLKLSPATVSNTSGNRFVVIRLSADNKTGQHKAVLNTLRNSGKTELVRSALRGKDGKDVVVDEGFYVKLKAGTSMDRFMSFLNRNKCEIEKKYRYHDRVFLLKATAANGFDGLKMANLFYESGLFEYSEPDFRAFDLLHAVPNDPLFNLQWAHLNMGSLEQGSGVAGVDIDTDEAWDITQGSPTIRIAVIDEGVQRSHPDLVNNIDPLGFGLATANATTGDILGTGRSHGTSCAGIIAAEANNGIGVSGVAPLSKIIPVNITTNSAGAFGTYAQIAQAIDWSWNEGGADILSNSWGGGLSSSLVRDAIRRAITLGRGGKGSVVIFSTGNNDAGVLSPAIFPETIAVGALSMCNERTSPSSCDGEVFWGSNFGVGTDLAAPGVRIATTRVTGTGAAPNPDYNLGFNGTSSAAPMVAGVAALVLSVNNQLSEQQVRDILETSAKKSGPYTYQQVPGQPNGSWSPELGYGVVNAKNAVLAAQNPVLCKVEISAAGSLQVCSGGTVALQVSNPVSGDSYQWRLNGTDLATGTSFNASLTGNYDVVLTTSSGCTATSSPLPVLVSAPLGALAANAGEDAVVCLGNKIFLGGGPAGSGGTAIHHPMRAMALELFNNELIRFNPRQPALEYRVVKSGFNPNPSGSNFFPGAAVTPFGLYMLSRNDRNLLRIDTATGEVMPIGVTTTASISFNGMTYDNSTGRILAVGMSGTVNQLFEINRLTGAATLLGNITGIPTSRILLNLAVDNGGQLFAVRQVVGANSSAVLYTINKTTLVATAVGTTGFQADYAQDGTVDPITDELYHFGITHPLGAGGTNFQGRGLWRLDKTNGQASLVGSVALPANSLDALAIAAPEYKYQWSPATHLNNPNDANPQFTATTPGVYTYTLTVTDLCGNTASDEVTITVSNPPAVPVISPASAELSHLNGFTQTLSIPEAPGFGYRWLVNGLEQTNTTSSFEVNNSFASGSQFAVRVTDAATGCSSVSLPVINSFLSGVLLNSFTPLTVCNSSFYDGGGATGLTGNSFTRSFTPATAGTMMKLSIYSLQLASFASLQVFDGASASAPRIAYLDNTNNGNNLLSFTASNPAGVLTVQFTRSGTNSAGWLAGLTCELPLQYRSVANGGFNEVALWESKLPEDPESAWTPALRPPVKGDDLITVRHNLTVTSNLEMDQLVVASGGKLEVLGNGALSAFKVRPGTDITVEEGGSLELAASKLIVGTGGIMEVKGELINNGEITLEQVSMNGSVAQQLVNSGGETYIRKLVVNNPAGLTITGLHRTGILELQNGLVNTTAGNTLIVEENSIGSEASHVNGPLQISMYTGAPERDIPIGHGGLYRPLRLVANNYDAEGFAVFEAEVVAGAPATRIFPLTIGDVSTKRYYRVTPVSNPVNMREFSITLPYGTDDGVSDPAILRIAKDDGAGNWIDLAGTATGAAPGTITSAVFNSFSDFVLANLIQDPLPVTLLSFTGNLVENAVQLNWRVENEIGFDRYEIERSEDGRDFKLVGTIAARQTSLPSLYSYTDKNLPAEEKLFYRLKMLDLDGRFTYSKMILLKRDVVPDSKILVAPNPFVSHFTVQVPAAHPGKIQMELLDQSGKLIMKRDYLLQSGLNQLYLETGRLPAGTYFLRMYRNGSITIKSLICQ